MVDEIIQKLNSELNQMLSLQWGPEDRGKSWV